MDILRRADADIARPHPPIPTISLPPLPPAFDDIPQPVESCWNAYFGHTVTSHFLKTEYDKSTTRLLHTYNPPLEWESTYKYDTTKDCSTAIFGLTTLCDGVLRAQSSSVDCKAVSTVGTVTGYEYYSEIGVLAPTWTSDYEEPSPTCQVARDLSPMCARLFEAWTYRAGQMRAAPSAPSDVGWRITQAIPPCTPLMTQPASTNRPVCRAAGATYSAYYWPTATPSGEDYCNVNWTAPTGTPTIRGIPNTAVVLGITLTSPDVYHLLKDLRVETYRGRAGQPGGIGNAPYDAWELSTVLGAVTVAQPESGIFQASKRCKGIEGDQCTVDFSPDFRIQDLQTIRTDTYDKYCTGRCGPRGNGVMYQDCYQPTLAIPIGEIVRQNGGILAECDWPLYEANDEGGWTSYTTSSVAAVLVKDVKAVDFVPIVTKTTVAEITAAPLPGSAPMLQTLPTISL